LHATSWLTSADNGYAIGTHRRQPGKTLGFEEDIHVPLIARGPGIPAGKRDSLSSYGMVDLSRTILDIAAAHSSYENDGVRINLHQGEADLSGEHKKARHSISEYWVLGAEEGIYAGGLRVNNSELGDPEP
jgi:arylsulfatase A-like enzyme